MTAVQGGHLFLVGFMGAGKSTVGQLLAERRGLPFVDLDARIESEADMPVAEIFAVRGEEGFRLLESAMLEALASEPDSVVACGGGIVSRPRNCELLKSLGTVIHLKVSAGEALARIGDTSTRPLLSGPGATIAATALLEARQSLYCSVADVVVDTMGHGAEEVAILVEARLEEGTQE